MKLPVISGVIRRRVLLNYRVAPRVAQAVIPDRFRPKLIDGFAVAGICLIRLEKIRPKGFPAFCGIDSENAAHRFAVEWEDDSGATCQGVFIPRRDTDSKLNAFAGGRLFPGVHHLSSFTVIDDAGVVSVRVVVKGCDEPLVDFEGCETDVFPEGSAFGSLQAASEFFKAGSLGYSSRPCSCTLDGLLLKVPEWNVRPLAVHRVKSSFLDDRSVFPRESIQFDHALVMRDCLHEWHSKSTMSAEGSES